ncbi:MAG: diadenylate cyclase CdaA [Oscillospiraceae bacterium]|nr:diadenylate cyclase CdaA [Oscillospiraceae bacterium]
MLDSIINALQSFIVMFRLSDFIDIVIIAFCCYKLITIVNETRAKPIIKAVILIVAATWVSQLLNLNTVNYILRTIMQFGVIALVVLFQPELRRTLEKVGKARFSSLFMSDDAATGIDVAEEIASACTYMSSLKIGALIAIERQVKIGDIIRTGCAIDGVVSRDLLINTFIPNTPLHDGAVIIRDGRVIAARCILPLTKDESLSSELGTRHRAAIGLTESSDAVVVVVSEETGKISVAVDGDISRNYNEELLRRAINKALDSSDVETSENVKTRIGGLFQWKK